MHHTIKIPERFTFESNRWFRLATEKINKEDSLIFDFEKTVYIDSSALGMILVAHDRFGSVAAINCEKNVIAIFEIANFKKLFSIKRKGE